MTNPLVALYRLLLRHQLTKGRIVLIGALGGLSLLVGFVAGRNLGAGLGQEVANSLGALSDTANFIHFLGIGLVVPIISLVLASSTLGDLIEDETLVYLWHRPIARWNLAVAAWASAATVAVPATVIPLGMAAFLSSGFSIRATGAAALAVALAAIGYSGLFTLFGLVLKRALIWGLIYLFIWELFVARVGAGAAKVSLNTYPSSVLANLTDTSIRLAERSTTVGIIVPLLVAASAVALTAWRLNRIDVA